MVVGTMFCYVACQLGNLELSRQIPLETAEENFALSRFEPVHQARNSTDIALVGEVNKLFVHKMLISYLALLVIAAGVRVVVGEPVFSLGDFFLGKCHFYCLIIILVFVGEVNDMGREVGEVLLRLTVCGGPQPFVVLNLVLA